VEATLADSTGALLADLPHAELASGPNAFRPVRCPSCGRTAERATFAARAKAIVDVCAAHGVWFDAGELAAALLVVLRRERRPEGEPIDEWLDSRQRLLDEEASLHKDPTNALRNLEGARLDWLSVLRRQGR
jgi:Zn-finger nucleic acid-binding protein